MATADQIAELRRKVSEPDTTTYSDVTMNAIIDEEGNVDDAAVRIWTEKASIYSELVDISEAGSSRKNSQLMTNALRMAEFYKTGGDPALSTTGILPTTTPIRRA